MSYTLHCTKKLMDRIKAPGTSMDSVPTNLLGNWYATALFWKPQVALLVNEHTLLPVLMPLAPVSTLAERFPAYLTEVLIALDVEADFITAQVATMGEVQFAKTSNRSVLGIVNQFSYLVEGYREYVENSKLLELSLKLAHVPCSPLYKRETFPDRELHHWIKENWQSAGSTN